jgi:phosphoserine phosphatase
MLAEAGISVAFHAKPALRERASHALDHAGLDGVLNLFL